MRRRMVVLLVDALGWELARRTPDFARSLSYRRRLDTVLGFSSGALPTLFTGQRPSEHGRWLMYRRATANGTSPFAGFEWLGLLPTRIRESHRLGSWLTRRVASRGVRGYFHLYQVPRALLSRFDLAERDDIFAPRGLPVASLWDTLEREGVPWRGWNWRSEETRNFEELERSLIEGDQSFLFCYTADLDALLHREGSHGPSVEARLRRYDQWIARLEHAAKNRGDELWFYLLSDHGMVDVTSRVDVMGRLRSLEAQWPRDYLAFFDSTMARFWWRERAARERVHTALAAEPRGRWLTDSELEAQGVKFAGREYGDDIFLLEPGALMVPSFMGENAVAAMHGYAPSHPDMAALLWSNRPLPESLHHLRDVRGFLETQLRALRAEAA